MTYKGVARGRTIDLDEPVSLPEGTRVTVSIAADHSPRRGSPAAVLKMAGTLTIDEAESILHAAQSCRRVDESFWNRNG